MSRFLENGFELEAKAVLSTSAVVPPPRVNLELDVRPISTEQEWSEMIHLQVDSAHVSETPDKGLSLEQWRDFYTNQSLRYQAMIRGSRGQWFGGFLRGRSVSNGRSLSTESAGGIARGIRLSWGRY